MSSENPYLPPASTSLGSSMPIPQAKERLRRIANAQRQVNLALLLYIAIFPVSFGLGAVGGGAPWAALLLGLFALAVIILGAISVYRLAAVFRGKVVALIYVIGLLVPLLGLLLLLSISGKATKELRAAGIKVGLLGANPSDI
ncbi:MAG: hypothetical protein KDA72_03930 [Planctomycetales bacterium]|nr:hypothetical protein [Planctomycetales bacterium]